MVRGTVSWPECYLIVLQEVLRLSPSKIVFGQRRRQKAYAVPAVVRSHGGWLGYWPVSLDWGLALEWTESRRMGLGLYYIKEKFDDIRRIEFCKFTLPIPSSPGALFFMRLIASLTSSQDIESSRHLTAGPGMGF